jgi:hypothetical protein
VSVEDLFEGQVLTQYVVIAEVLDESGERGLRMTSGDASGQLLPWWTLEGLIAAAGQVCASCSPIVEDPDE